MYNIPEILACERQYLNGTKHFENVEYESALYYFLQAAEYDHVKSQFFVGSMYKLGQGTTQNMADALSWYTKAVKDEGAIEVNFGIGFLYFDGSTGVSQGCKLASQHFKKAAENNDHDAQNYVGHMHENGYGVQVNYFATLEQYKKSAVSNSEYAQSNIARFYYFGHGVKEDFKIAFTQFEKLAEQNSACA